MDTRKEVLFVLIEEYADWEFALLAPGLRRGFGIWEPQYDVRTVAADAGPVMSIGGVRCLPDYTFETIPDDYAALVLVGGMNWWGEEARRVVPLVEQAQARQIVVGAICDASAFLGAAFSMMSTTPRTGWPTCRTERAPPTAALRATEACLRFATAIW